MSGGIPGPKADLRSAVALVVCLAACFAAAWIGSRFTLPSIPGYYAALQKPSWTPPNWAFAPVWSALYLLMAIAVWLVWCRAGWTWAVGLFVIQLFFNLIWSAIFFAMQLPGWAFLDILLLIVALFATIVAFARIWVTAACLLLPYLFWVAYAAAVNFAIWQMNA